MIPTISIRTNRMKAYTARENRSCDELVREYSDGKQCKVVRLCQASCDSTSIGELHSFVPINQTSGGPMRRGTRIDVARFVIAAICQEVMVWALRDTRRKGCRKQKEYISDHLSITSQGIASATIWGDKRAPQNAGVVRLARYLEPSYFLPRDDSIEEMIPLFIPHDGATAHCGWYFLENPTSPFLTS